MNRKGLREIVENTWNIKALADVSVEMGQCSSSSSRPGVTSLLHIGLASCGMTVADHREEARLAVGQETETEKGKRFSEDFCAERRL